MDAIIQVADRADWLAALTAAADLDRPVTVLSPPGFALHGGIGLFMALRADARKAVPTARFGAVIDCGADWARAHAAIAQGLDGVRLDAPEPVLDKLRALAARTGERAAVHGPDWPPAAAVLRLSRLEADARVKACRQWIEAQES